MLKNSKSFLQVVFEGHILSLMESPFNSIVIDGLIIWSVYVSYLRSYLPGFLVGDPVLSYILKEQAKHHFDVTRVRSVASVACSKP